MPDTIGGEDSVVLGSENSSEPDYNSVELPAKPPTEYSYVERRGELLQLIEQAGHPRALNQTELADRYGVSQQQISKDFDRIARHIRAQIPNRDRRAMVVDNVVNRAIQGLLDEGEYRKAATTAMEWDEWITEFHDLEKMHEEIQQLKEAREGDGRHR